MNDIAKEPSPGGVWFTAAKFASAIGGAIAFSSGILWFTEAGGHCGVVRFYEYLFGFLVVGAWLIGTAVGWGTAIISRRNSARSMVIAGWGGSSWSTA